MSKMKKANFNDMFEFEPQTTNQRIAYDAWDDDDNLVLTGSAGTGKTFVAMYLAIEAVLTKETPYDRVVIVRSVVPTRDMGFLPGTIEEKKEVFETPYKAICNELFGDVNIYDRMIANNQLQFTTTSFIRGLTIDNAVVIVDEMQNLNFHELDSIITRLGVNTKIIFAGDAAQTDLVKTNERNGILDFMKIIQGMDEFEMVEFGIQDIIRSGLVKSYLINKLNLGL